MQSFARIEVLFSTLIDLSSEKRMAFIDAECGGDSELHRELVSLLRSHEATRGVLDSPPQLPGIDIEQELLASGTELGPWRIGALIGRGGAGDVYSAMRGDGAFEQKVAIKVLRREASTEVARFRSERQILAQLDHPGMSRLLDGGVCPDGRLYTVMEFVDGVPLTQYCKESHLTLRDRLRLFTQVCEVVAYAHRSLIVHRDLKPANIVVEKAGRARLLDFGIAKLLETEDGAVVRGEVNEPMTPDYAAPEQLTGQAVTTATDVYSLGIILFELLTDRRPWVSADFTAIRTASRVTNEIAPAPSVLAAQSSATAFPAKQLRGDLDAIVGMCLQRSQNARYETVTALQADIEHFLRGEPVRANPISSARRTFKFVARHRLFSAAAAAALTAILSAAAIAVWQAQEARRERDGSQALAERNRAVSEFLRVVVTGAPRAGRAISVDQLLERSKSFAERAFAHNPEHQAAALLMLASNFQELGNVEKARPLIERARELARNSRDPSLDADLKCQHAMLLSRTGEIDTARSLVDDALDNESLASQSIAGCLHVLASMARYAGDGASTLVYARRAVQKLRESNFQSPILEAQLLGNIAAGLNLTGATDEADRQYAAVVSRFEQLGLERSPQALMEQNDWAIVSRNAGNEWRALEIYNRLLQYELDDDPSSAPSALIQANRATTLEMVGRYTEALSAYKQALAAAERAQNAVPAAHALLGLARTSSSLGQLDEAERYLADATKLESGVTTAGSSTGVAIRLEAAQIALARGRTDEAFAIFAEIISQNRLGYRAVALRGRARIHLDRGNIEAARQDAQQSLAIAKSLQKNQKFSSRTGNAWLMLGRVLQRENKTEEARAAYRNAVINLENTVDPLFPALVEAKRLVQTLQ
jgi:serine/threonine protein kinase